MFDIKICIITATILYIALSGMTDLDFKSYKTIYLKISSYNYETCFADL